MSNDLDKVNHHLGRGVEKLAGTLDGIVELIAGPERIVKRARARAESEIMAAEAEAAKSEIAARTADRLRNREYRRQRNVESITDYAAAQLQLPGPLSDAPVDQDFIYRFFEEAQDIGNAEMQQLWGKLLAGEVRQPGTFKPRTLRVLKDMTASDAEMFASLCSFVWSVGSLQPVILDHNLPIYTTRGITFDALTHLDSAGLIVFSPIDGFAEDGEGPDGIDVSYFDFAERLYYVEGAPRQIVVGECLFTEAGRELCRLCECEPIPEFRECVLESWKQHRVGQHEPAPT